MSITDQEVKKLAELARLNLPAEEREKLTGDLNEILELAEKIDEVETEGVEPTYHALPVQNVYRSDQHRPSPDPRKVLEHAPDHSDGYFVVPRVIEDE